MGGFLLSNFNRKIDCVTFRDIFLLADGFFEGQDVAFLFVGEDGGFPGGFADGDFYSN